MGAYDIHCQLHKTLQVKIVEGQGPSYKPKYRSDKPKYRSDKSAKSTYFRKIASNISVMGAVAHEIRLYFYAIL